MSTKGIQSTENRIHKGKSLSPQGFSGWNRRNRSDKDLLLPNPNQTSSWICRYLLCFGCAFRRTLRMIICWCVTCVVCVLQAHFCLTLPHTVGIIHKNLWVANSSLEPKLRMPSYQNAPANILTPLFQIKIDSASQRCEWTFSIRMTAMTSFICSLIMSLSRILHLGNSIFPTHVIKHLTSLRKHEPIGNFWIVIRTVKKHFVANLCLLAKYRRLLKAASLCKLLSGSQHASEFWP